jgi:hypothetical protein
LLVQVALLVALTPLFVGVHQGTDCSQVDRETGGCPTVSASLDADQLNLIGSTSTPGSASGGATGAAARKPGPDRRIDVEMGCAIPVGSRCYGRLLRAATAVPAAPALATPALTLRDLASFRPAPGRQQMEPNGWVVPGLDANFYAIVNEQLVPGTLLGQPATVRFTPVGYHWNYGDGGVAVRSTKGGTWAQLGFADFAQTPTSHVYASEGEYVIRLTIDFRAEYKFGGGGSGGGAFLPVAGRINLLANDLRVTVSGAKTVLVDHDCIANPSGPGC